MFVEDLSNELVIGEKETAEDVDNRAADGFGKGYEPRDYAVDPANSIQFAAPLDIPIIPRDQWRDRIEEMVKTKSRLSDIVKYEQLQPSNQKNLPFCWMHGMTNAMRVLRAADNQEYVDLSPTMAASIITNYRPRGGNTPEAIRFLSEHGVCSVEHWPHNEVNRRHDTPEARANAKKHRIREWYELRQNSFDHMMTCLINRLPVAAGFMWWRHLVCVLDPVADSRGFSIRAWNSWGSGYGENGIFILPEKKAVAFDQLAPRTSTWSTD